MSRLALGALAGLVALAVPADAGSQGHYKVKVSTLSACPERGAENPGTPHALLNELKHHAPAGTTPVRLDFADIGSLQHQADALVRTGKDSALTPRDRAKLRDLPVGGGHVGEGDLVAMAGFVVGKPEPNIGESVNCFLRGPSNNDFHIEFAAAPHASPYEGIVVEMIPQDRPKAWTLARLRRLSDEGRQVLVSGQLLLDSIHKPNPSRGASDDPPRTSIWEIHPVTKVLVCRRAQNDCDPSREEQWQELDSVVDR